MFGLHRLSRGSLSTASTALHRLQPSRTKLTLARDVFICSAARTPIASINSHFKGLTAVQLAVVAAKAAISRAAGSPEIVQECIMGNVLSAGLGQSPARQVALGAGCLPSTEAVTLNKVCASGMKAVMIGAQNIAMGARDVVLAGGMESMTNSPYILKQLRGGASYGHVKAEDTVQLDGLTDAFDNHAMGVCAEDTASKLGITRQQADEYAARSYTRSNASVKTHFAKEIVGVEVPQKKGQPVVISTDEEPSKFNPEKMATLKPVFKKDGGVVTAANASSLNDGAACLLLASAEAVKRHRLSPMAIIRGFGDAARKPIEFPMAPALATPIALEAAGVSTKDIAQWEINEAFAVVVLANVKLLDIDINKVNPYGGAVSLGHPIGMSGARIVGSLVHHLAPGAFGCASVCNGGGAASAIVIQKL